MKSFLQRTSLHGADDFGKWTMTTIVCFFIQFIYSYSKHIKNEKPWKLLGLYGFFAHDFEGIMHLQKIMWGTLFTHIKICEAPFSSHHNYVKPRIYPPKIMWSTLFTFSKLCEKPYVSSQNYMRHPICPSKTMWSTLFNLLLLIEAPNSSTQSWVKHPIHPP